jgi:hypothetical protein
MRSIRRRLSRCAIVVLLPLAVVSGTAPAFADEPSAQDIAQARELGQQAQAAHEAGDYAQSEKLWAAAQKLYPVAPTLTLGLARAQAKLGKVVAAQESYNRIIREWGNHASPPPAFKDAVEQARAEVGAVSARVANVVITVDGPPDPEVTVDGVRLPPAALGLRRPVDPGKHTVRATAEGYEPTEATFSVAEGASAEARLKLEAADGSVASADPGATPGAAPDAPGPEQAEPKRGSTNKTLAIVAFGVGGAGLVLGAVTGLLAMGKHGDLEAQCAGSVCPPSAQSDLDSYQTMGTLSTLGFITAGVGAAAGAVLWFTAPKQTGAAASSRYATERTKPTVVPYLGVGAAGVTGRF